MPVYLLAGTRKKDGSWIESFLKRWVAFIKGPVDHIEISFVDVGRPVYGFTITMFSERQRFCAREYESMYESFDVTWYEVKTIDQVACERYAESKNKTGRISIMSAMRSGMPFDSDIANRTFADFMETSAMPPEALVEEGDEFCASSVMKALKTSTGDLLNDVDPYRCTANDVLQYAKRRLGAERVDEPKFVKNVDPEIVRSERWYAHNS